MHPWNFILKPLEEKEAALSFSGIILNMNDRLPSVLINSLLQYILVNIPFFFFAI